jgi:transcription elongation GreA/GreB family factor
MNTSSTLSAADAASIRRLLDARDPRHGIPPTARAALDHLLAISQVSSDDAVLENHVGLHDPVTLVNPDDSSDWYRMVIVTPTEGDVDQDRIPLSHPMCLAVLGRRLNEPVEWDTNHGIRRMRIAELEKNTLAGV